MSGICVPLSRGRNGAIILTNFFSEEDAHPNRAARVLLKPEPHFKLFDALTGELVVVEVEALQLTETSQLLRYGTCKSTTDSQLSHR